MKQSRPNDPPETEDAAWLLQAKLGLFIHWLAFSAYGEDGEMDQHLNEPYETFKRLMSRFTLSDFDPDTFVRKAKARGFRYLIPTAHHADGFCLWDTNTSEFKMTNAPARMDVVGELAKACRRHGLKFGVYFPYCDLSHPLVQKLIPQGQGDSGQWGDQNPLPPGELKSYRAHLQEQVRELCSNYGKLDLFFWDAGPADLEWAGLVKRMVYKLQPGILQNSRWGTKHFDRAANATGMAGDYFTPEQNVPSNPLTDRGRAVPFETCITTINNWLYEKSDRHFKSARSLTHALIEAVSKGGNLLVNIGPDTRGRVQPEVDAALDEMGAWVAKHAEAIWDAGAGPRHDIPEVALTRRDRILYVHYYGKKPVLTLPEFGTPLQAAAAVGTGQAIRFQAAGGQIELDLGNRGVDPIGTVLRLQFEEPPRQTSTPAPIPPTALARAGGGDKWDAAGWTTVTAKNGRAVYVQQPTPDELSFRFAAVNDAQVLRICVEVTQSDLVTRLAERQAVTDHFAEAAGAKANEALVNSSSVELYFDALPPAPEVTADQRCFQIIVTAAGKSVLCFADPDKVGKVSYDARVTMIADGYRVECAVPFASLLKDRHRQATEYDLTNFFGLPRQDIPLGPGAAPVKPGDTIGFNVSVNARFAAADGAMVQKLWWQCRTHNCFNDPQQWGRLALAKIP